MIQVAGEDHVAIGTDGNISPAVLDPTYRAAFAASVREWRKQGIAAGLNPRPEPLRQIRGQYHALPVTMPVGSTLVPMGVVTTPASVTLRRAALR